MEGQKDFQEVFIGLVAPLGCDIDPSVAKLEELLKDKDFCVQRIKITDLVLKDDDSNSKPTIKKIETLGLPKSFIYYLKMELCTEIRFKKGKGYLAALAVNAIKEARANHLKSDEKKNCNSSKMVYLIDQIKNEGEHALLSNLYDKNYIQISFFSEASRRNEALEQKFRDDLFVLKDLKVSKIKDMIRDEFKKLYKNNKKESYRKEIRPDCSSKLIKKDYSEKNEFGQQIAKIFHKSHYFIDLDHLEKLDGQVEKFLEILFGKFKKYPTREEFGMFLAAGVACRSNFPSDRQVGAAIVDENGEVLACGSIRAPSSSANPTREHMLMVEESYKRAKEYANTLTEDLDKNSSEEMRSKKEIKDFIKSAIEHFPFTHGEMSAISDAAKKGISVKGATLYVTTFPCHLCAKDIITAGIGKVVFLEAYPKSKTKELYLDLIAIDSPYEDRRVTFDTFSGVGPKWYTEVYGIENKHFKSDESKKNGEKVEREKQGGEDDGTQENTPEKPLIPLLKHRSIMNYEKLEEEVLKMCNILDESSQKTEPEQGIHPGVKRQFEADGILKSKTTRNQNKKA